MGKYLIFVLFLVIYVTDNCYGGENSEDDFMKLTMSEKAALDKFREMMLPHLKDAHMKEDIYLVRWLKARNFNTAAAQNMLLDNLRWRTEKKIDSILQEDFSDMYADFPYNIDARDEQGRPIGSLYVGSWNLRRAVLTGKLPRLIRYMTRLLEANTKAVTEAMYQGKNVTMYKVVADLDGFNLIQHGCALCMSAYTSFVTTSQNRYPGYTHKFILLNTPPAFKTVLDVITPLFTPRTRRIFKVFGRDKSQWIDYLSKDISKDQLSKLFAIN